MKNYITITEFASELGITSSCVRKWILSGRLNYHRIGPQGQIDCLGRDRRAIRIPRSEIRHFREKVYANENSQKIT